MVLVHGLDSSKETWCGVLAELAKRGYPALALDQRGHGESPLGDPEDFSPEALAQDVLHSIREHGIKRYVLVGHSMGGRVAMRAAAIAASQADATSPTMVACVIEDMDATSRSNFVDEAAQPMSGAQAASLERFTSPKGRRFASWEAARHALLQHYVGEDERVDAWRGSRVRPEASGSWWCDLNPAARRLAGVHVLASNDGSHAWDELAAHGERLPFSVHVWYADDIPRGSGTVCTLKGRDGLEDMARRLPSAQLKFFADSGHSIHNTQRAAFLDALCGVVDGATRAS